MTEPCAGIVAQGVPKGGGLQEEGTPREPFKDVSVFQGGGKEGRREEGKKEEGRKEAGREGEGGRHGTSLGKRARPGNEISLAAQKEPASFVGQGGHRRGRSQFRAGAPDRSLRTRRVEWALASTLIGPFAAAWILIGREPGMW